MDNRDVREKPPEVDIKMAGFDVGSGYEASFLKGFNKRFEPTVRWLMAIAGTVLFLYMIFMFMDVLLRYLFNKPIPYDVDVTRMILVILCFFSIGYTQLVKGHVNVDLFTSRLSARANLTLSTAMYAICVILAILMTWQGVLNAIHYHDVGILTYGGMPLFPASVIMPLGEVFFTIVFLRDLINKYAECKHEKFGVVRWLLMVGLPVAFMIVAALGIHQILTPINNFTAGVLAIGALFLLIFLGMPIGFALLAVSVILMGYCAGPKPGYLSLGMTVFSQISSYTWIVIPLYILMSYFILIGGLGTAAFWGAYKFIGHIRGGLAMAVVGGSTALAAVVGTGSAAMVTMGLIAYPEMRRYKYDDGLATGCISAGAQLGPVIPPSMPFIVYGILTETSIGALFIAGIIPGIMLALAYVAVITLTCRIKPSYGPPSPRIPWGERIRAFPNFGPIIILFIIVIGGIYGGVFTVMEGGGIGCFGSLMIALASKSMTFPKLKEGIRETMRFVGMIFMMVSGSLILANALGQSGVSGWIADKLLATGLSGMGIVMILLIIYLLFGLVADAPIILMLTIPVLWPLLEQMGVDLVWFGVVSAVVAGMGGITPPYAMGIFILRAIACPDVPLRTMYRGIIPFCVATVVVVALWCIWPNLVVWLPNIMRG